MEDEQVVEMPVVEDAVEESPVVEEVPVVEEIPVVEEVPVVEETPAPAPAPEPAPAPAPTPVVTKPQTGIVGILNTVRTSGTKLSLRR